MSDLDGGEHLELSSTGDDSPSGRRVEARLGGRAVAVFLEQATASGSRLVLTERRALIDETGIHMLLAAIAARARGAGGTTVELDTSDPLLRQEARWHGFAGPLRGPLVASVDGAAGHGAELPAPREVGASGTVDAEVVRAAVERLLPGIPVVLGRGDGPLRALLRRATSGIPSTFDLYASPGPGETPTRFAVPNRSDLLGESIARCIDTVVEIRRRFGRAASPIQRVSFDHADFQLLHGYHAGSADRSAGVIHFNASFASVEGLLAMELLREERPGGGSAGVPAPYNQIDGTTAHEAWHQIEGALEARRSLDGIELRRRLGEQLGVETLEQAVRGSRPRSPDSWKRAHARLVDEVSPYAATAPIEATAEMFKLWWCANGAPSPIVARFGTLIEGLLADFMD